MPVGNKRDSKTGRGKINSTGTNVNDFNFESRHDVMQGMSGMTV